MSQKSNSPADAGDYLKLGACTAVMLQTVLGFGLALKPSSGLDLGLVEILVKFTAPAFIFGILYSTIRTNVNTDLKPRQYYRLNWHQLVIPSILWTSVYLLFLPQLQQRRPFHDLPSFLWQFISGNAAPHLWYNTMMLQFILLMPLFWLLARWGQQHQTRSLTAVIAACLLMGLWLYFYQTQIFHGPHQAWYLTDRIFPGFLLYGVLGTLAALRLRPLTVWLKRLWPLLGLIAGISAIWAWFSLKQFGLPVSFANVPYASLALTCYDLAIIGLLLTLSASIHADQINFWVHRLASFAYKAYLGNVFWAYLLWQLFGKRLAEKQLGLGIALTYLCTWLLAFACALGLHGLWQNLKKRCLTAQK